MLINARFHRKHAAAFLAGIGYSFHQIPGFGLIELVEPLLAHTGV
jgi:hypothetical protein